MIIGKGQVIEKSNLTSRFDNSDHDGDSIIALALHSNQAKEDFKYAFVKNNVEFEHMDELLIDYEHESIYAAYMLTYQSKEDEKGWAKTNDEISLKTDQFDIYQFIRSPGKTFKYMNSMEKD